MNKVVTEYSMLVEEIAAKQKKIGFLRNCRVINFFKLNQLVIRKIIIAVDGPLIGQVVVCIKNKFDSGPFADNVNNYNDSEQFRVGFSPKYKYSKGELVLNSSANLIERDYFRFGGITNYKSRNINADAFNKYKINPNFIS